MGLFIAGIPCVAAGLILNLYFPINKNLWTSSFVLFTGGLAMLLLAACYWVIDMRGWRAWGEPFLVFGRNAIFSYALAAIVSEISTDFDFIESGGEDRTLHGWLYQKYFVPHASPVNASLAFGIFFVLVIFVLVWPLHRKKIFIRI
jgi:predicted acyltransferase